MDAVRSVIRFQVKPGREAEFEAAFAESGMLSRPRELEGFEGAELIRAVDGGGEYLVIGVWRDAETYRQWQARSAAGAPAAALKRLVDTLDDPRPGALYALVAQSPASDA